MLEIGQIQDVLQRLHSTRQKQYSSDVFNVMLILSLIP